MATRAQALAMAAATTVVVLAAALAADRYASHGVTVEWRTERGAVVARTVEHRTTFPNEHRPLSRYVQGWDFERWGVPDELPALDARLTGTLTVPEGPRRRFHIESPNETRLVVDGKEAGPDDPLSPGRHDLALRWTGQLERATKLVVHWSVDGDRFEPVPATAFTPAGGPWSPLRKGLWTLAPLLAALLGLLVFRCAVARDFTARRRRVFVLGATVLVVLTLGYRLFDYSVMPELRENPDELFATWNGWQLLDDGTTRGWSLWPHAYGDRVDIEPVSYFRKRPIRNIVPYLEHPPLLHLMAGAAAKIGGASHWAHARLAHTRLVPIGLTVVVVLLLLAVGRRLALPRPATWFGGLLYAVLPIIAIQGRVIKEEALVAPLGLASVLFFLRWRDDGERGRDLLGAAATAGLATLAKVPGLVFLPAVVALVLARGRPRAALLAAAAGLAVASLLLVYGAWVDWDLFWFTTAEQATGRPAHWNLFPRFFDDPLINHNLVGRPWLIFLWLGYIGGVVASDRRTAAVLTVPPLLYLLAIGLASGNWTFGWYLMPIYPFLCLGTGRFLADLWRRPNLWRGVLFVILPLMYGMLFLDSVETQKSIAHWAVARRQVTVFLILLLTPYALAQIWRSHLTRTLARVGTAAGLALLVVVSGFIVVRYDVLYETHRNLDRVEFFDR